MIGPAGKFLVRTLAAVAAAAAVIVAAAAWRMSAGPVSLAFLTPYVQEALSYDGALSFRVELDDTILTWAGWDRTLDVRAIGVRMLSTEGSLVAQVPEISLGLDGRSILKGKVQPTRLDLIAPESVLVRNLDGTIDFGLGGTTRREAEQIVARLAGAFMEPLGDDRLGGALSHVSVLDANLTVVDRPSNSIWRFPETDIVLLRDGEWIKGEAAVQLQIGNRRFPLVVSATYGAATEKADVRIAFADVEPALLARQASFLAPFSHLELAVTGEVDFSVGLDGAVSDAAFDIAGGAGYIDATAWLPEKLAVVHAKARGHVASDLAWVRVDELRLDAGGASAELTGTVTLSENDPRIDAEGTVQNLPVGDLKRYWPLKLAPVARDWVITNVHAGTMEQADFRIAVSAQEVAERNYPDDAFDIRFRFDDAEAHYFRPLPMVTGARGVGHLTTTNLTIEVGRARVQSLAVSEGRLDITGLRTPRKEALISFVASGSIGEGLAILDREPLGFATASGIDPAEVGGLGSARARFKFVVSRTLTPKEIEFAAAANLIDVSAPSAFGGLGAEDGELSLRVDRSGLEVEGGITVQGVPGRILWREDFRNDVETSSYRKYTTVLDDAERERFGFFVNRYLKGPISMRLEFFGARRSFQRAELALNLEEAVLDFPELLWQKPPGVAGSASAQIVPMDDDGLLIESFVLITEGLHASGAAELDSERRLRRLDLAELAYGKTRLAASLRPQAGRGYIVALDGDTLDFEAYIEEFLRSGEPKEIPPLNLSIRLNHVLVSADQRLSNVTGRAQYDGERWNTIVGEGTFAGSAQPLKFAIETADNQRTLRVTTADAGSFASSIGFYDNAQGGVLELSAVIRDDLPNRPVAGRIEIRNFTVVNAPVLAGVMTLASLDGIAAAARGDGISFIRLEAPFNYADGTLSAERVHAFGPALGITLDGTVNFDEPAIDVNGTIIPAYTMNSLLGDIPVLGSILVGQEGEGVFAMTYRVSGPLSGPQVTVNPLATFAPGFLRGFFSIFEGTVPEGTVFPDHLDLPSKR